MVFFPPELSMTADVEAAAEMGVGSGTDQMRALYYQKLHQPTDHFHSDRELVNLVIEHARRVIAHPSRPTYTELDSFSRNPFGEIALEETLEENPFLDSNEEFLVEVSREKRFSCVAMLDTSASMSGEKHLLASIAVAVLLLEVPSRDSSVLVFSSRANVIKNLSVDEKCEETILRFLKQQPRGFTNISDGLEAGLKQLRSKGKSVRKVGVIATDGRSTEGNDPLIAAAQYDFLVVLHLHGPGSHLDASKEIAQRGKGVCLEVERFDQLPYRLYEALRILVRM